MKNKFFKLTILSFLVLGIFNSCDKDEPAPCIAVNCLNGGECNNGVCDCPEGFTGQNCEISSNPCENIDCLNGGICINGECDCPDGYTGENCEITVQNYYCEVGSGGTDVHTKTKKYSEELLFQGGTEGYDSYRIPAIIRTNSGTLLAFCEGRKDNGHDYGDIDVVFKRSTDNGVTWSSLQLLFSKHGGTCGNPTPVLDKETGAIWVFMSYNDEFHNQFGTDGYDKIDEWGDRRVYFNTSYDDGITWDNLKNRTTELVPSSYTWDAVGPGNGIQIEHGNNEGRLIVPAIGRNIYSDDNGATWNYQMINSGTSEGTIVELCNGDLMRNDRPAIQSLKDTKRRQVSISTDSGETWSDWNSDDQLLSPICQASLIRYNEDYPPRLIFINPSCTIKRWKMRVRISYDEGNSWAIHRLLDEDKGGYSSLTKTSDFQIASLQEIGGNSQGNLKSIMFRKFNLAWILNGTPEPVN